MNEKDRAEFLEELKTLYKENCDFIASKKKEDSDFAHSVNLEKANKVNAKLSEYITAFENRKCVVRCKEYWCCQMAQALYYNPNNRYNMLDDDNFPIDEDYD